MSFLTAVTITTAIAVVICIIIITLYTMLDNYHGRVHYALRVNKRMSGLGDIHSQITKLFWKGVSSKDAANQIALNHAY